MKRKKCLSPLVKHSDHQVDILPSQAHNLAKFWCRDCGIFIAWLSRKESQIAYDLGLVKNTPNTSHFSNIFDKLDK